MAPARLADELVHDAPLDIVQIHVLHVVTQPEGVWLHSHGLGELGSVDFDVLRPAEALTTEQFDVSRRATWSSRASCASRDRRSSRRSPRRRPDSTLGR
jgi:hypothetical protein